MKVLVIGGTGLISTPLVRMLAGRGDEVTVYNRARRQPALPPGARQIIGDRYDHARFVEQMRDAQAKEPWDVVIEMIGYAPEDVTNLSDAFGGKIKQMIFCSTVDVYAKPPAQYPILDDASQTYPAPWDYAQKKANCETVLRFAGEHGDFPVTIMRAGHTYSDTGALLHSLGGSTTYLDRLRRGKPVIVHGDGQGLWTSCHAEDVARAFVNACGNEKAFHNGYHVPGEEWLTWNDIHRIVADAVGGPPAMLVPIPSLLLAKCTDRAFICPVNFQYNNIFDTSAARADLDFRQTISFAEGARRVCETLTRTGKIIDCDTDPLDDRIIGAWARLTDTMVAEVKG